MTNRTSLPRAELFLCEDIRFEANDKHTLVGVFGGSTIEASVKRNEKTTPVMPILAVYVRLHGLEGENGMELSLTDPNGRELGRQTSAVRKLVATAPTNVIAKFSPFPIIPGTFRILSKFGETSIESTFEMVVKYDQSADAAD